MEMRELAQKLIEECEALKEKYNIAPHALPDGGDLDFSTEYGGLVPQPTGILDCSLSEEDITAMLKEPLV